MPVGATETPPSFYMEGFLFVDFPGFSWFSRVRSWTSAVFLSVSHPALTPHFQIVPLKCSPITSAAFSDPLIVFM